MATRLWYSAIVVASGYTADAGWEKVTGAVIRRLATTRSSLASTSVSLASQGTSGNDTLLGQWISPPLDVDQTITGTVKGQIRTQSGAAALDPRSQFILRVIKPDGTVRGTLLAMDAGALANEWSTTITNRQMPRGGALSLSSVAALAGDRIVAEDGIRQHAAGASNTALVYGGELGVSDLPEDESTTTALAPWLEFSQDITFTNEAAMRVSRATLTALVQNPTSDMRASRVTLTVLMAPTQIRAKSQAVLVS